MITSRFMGFVTEVKVSEGEQVKKDQILYTIDDIGEILKNEKIC